MHRCGDLAAFHADRKSIEAKVQINIPDKSTQEERLLR